jgi:hypothetical protein
MPVLASRCCSDHRVLHFVLLARVPAAVAALVADIACLVVGQVVDTSPATHCSRSVLSVLGVPESVVAARRWWPSGC